MRKISNKPYCVEKEDESSYVNDEIERIIDLPQPFCRFDAGTMRRGRGSQSRSVGCEVVSVHFEAATHVKMSDIGMEK